MTFYSFYVDFFPAIKSVLSQPLRCYQIVLTNNPIRTFDEPHVIPTLEIKNIFLPNLMMDHSLMIIQNFDVGLF